MGIYRTQTDRNISLEKRMMTTMMSLMNRFILNPDRQKHQFREEDDDDNDDSDE